MTTRPILRTIALWTAIILGCALFVLAAPPHPADADTHTTTIEFTGSDFYIPRPADRSDQVGVERLLASVDVLADLQGLTCSVVGTSANGESVHPNNYGMLRSNGDFVRIDGTEDEANGVRLSDRSIVLGATVQLFNVMLPDDDNRVATSVRYEVRVTCTSQPDDTTTTTTTTEPTGSSTTTVTTPSSTTSTTSSSSTTSTIPATTTTAPTDSTIPPNTSTSLPDTSTSTSTTVPGSTSSTTPDVTTPTLPLTGPPVEAAGIAMAAVALLVLGAGVLLAGRQS